MQLGLDLLVGGDEAGGGIAVIDDESGLHRRHGRDVAGRIGACQLRDLRLLHEREIDVDRMLGLEALDEPGELCRRQRLQQHLGGRAGRHHTRNLGRDVDLASGRIGEGRRRARRQRQHEQQQKARAHAMPDTFSCTGAPRLVGTGGTVIPI